MGAEKTPGSEGPPGARVSILPTTGGILPYDFLSQNFDFLRGLKSESDLFALDLPKRDPSLNSVNFDQNSLADFHSEQQHPRSSLTVDQVGLEPTPARLVLLD